MRERPNVQFAEAYSQGIPKGSLDTDRATPLKFSYATDHRLKSADHARDRGNGGHARAPAGR